MKFRKGDKVRLKNGNVIYLIIKVKGSVIHVEGFFVDNVSQTISGTIDTSVMKVERT